MRLTVDSCDLGLRTGYGRCAIDTSAPDTTDVLSTRQRRSRLAAGALLLGLVPLLRRVPVVAAVVAWFGISHIVAARIGYAGCPEIGAIPSAVTGRRFRTWCGPWDYLDEQLGV